MNEGKSTPVNIRITGKNLKKARAIADGMLAKVQTIDGVVDARIIQRLDYPLYMIEVDRAKAGDLGLTQVDVMRNVVAALNSSVQFNKKNFWIDPISHNQYYVGVQYPEADIVDLGTRRTVDSAPLGHDPEVLDLSADGRLAYVSAEDDKALAKWLQARGIRAGAVLTAGDMVQYQHLKSREFVQTIDGRAARACDHVLQRAGVLAGLKNHLRGAQQSLRCQLRGHIARQARRDAAIAECFDNLKNVSRSAAAQSGNRIE